ncbi:MAG: hypothetical protein QM758_00880 [Armatimonas sp.]
MKWQLGVIVLGIAFCIGVAFRSARHSSPQSTYPSLKDLKAVPVPLPGKYQWMLDGSVEIITPKKQRFLWNPSTGVTFPAKPLPQPPGILKKRLNGTDQESLYWSFSPDGKWTLITQILFQQRDYTEGLWPIKQRSWLMDDHGKLTTTPQPAYKPLEAGPLWLQNSSHWASTTATNLFIYDLNCQSISVPLPPLSSENWHRSPCGLLPDGKILIRESYQVVPEGLTEFVELEQLRFYTVDSQAPFTVSESADFPLQHGSTNTMMLPYGTSISPDGNHVVVTYITTELAFGQKFWGRFIAGPEPSIHFEVWVAHRDGSAQRCLYVGQELLYDLVWHPDSQHLLLQTAEQSYLITVTTSPH